MLLCVSLDDFLGDVEGGFCLFLLLQTDPFVDLWLMKNHDDDLLLFPAPW